MQGVEDGPPYGDISIRNSSDEEFLNKLQKGSVIVVGPCNTGSLISHIKKLDFIEESRLRAVKRKGIFKQKTTNDSSYYFLVSVVVEEQESF